MEEPITAFLDRLAARSPAPAGGASAALQAAQGAALVAMVARYVDSPTAADRLDLRRHRALALIEEDAAAYAGVLAADPGRRPAALVVASRPQAELCGIAVAVIEAATALVEQVGRGVAPDLAAGVLAAQCAARIAALNVTANLRGSSAPGAEELRSAVDSAAAAIEAAEELVARLTAR